MEQNISKDKEVLKLDFDAKKELIKEATKYLCDSRRESAESYIYGEKQSLGTGTIHHLRLLISEPYVEARRLREELKHTYNYSFRHGKNLSLYELCELKNVTPLQLIILANMTLIKNNKRLMCGKVENSFIEKQLKDVSTADFIKTLNADQKAILLKSCILEEDLAKVSLPSEKNRPAPHTYEYKVNYLRNIDSGLYEKRM